MAAAESVDLNQSCRRDGLRQSLNCASNSKSHQLDNLVSCTAMNFGRLLSEDAVVTKATKVIFRDVLLIRATTAACTSRCSFFGWRRAGQDTMASASAIAKMSVFAVLAHAWYGWREDETGIYAELQIASMPFKTNFAHMKGKKPRRVWIEVGAHAWENLQFSPVFSKSEEDFLISFEPLLDKYALLLSRYEADVTERRPLGFQHQRGLVFPFALGLHSSA